MLKIVAVMGAGGGAGASTLAAHLAAGLSAQKRDSFSVDFCPENVLRLHFGMPWNDDAGFARSLLEGQPWHAPAYRSAGDIQFLPFGNLHSESELEALTGWLASHPTWFSEKLEEIDFAPDTVVVCDCPRANSALRAQVLAVADLVLIAMAPDPVSYAAATRLADHVANGGGPATALVVNGFDPARALDRDIMAFLRTRFPQHLAPLLVHRDESLREALACKQTVFDFAPHSQAAYDMTMLVTWTLARLHQAAVPPAGARAVPQVVQYA